VEASAVPCDSRRLLVFAWQKHSDGYRRTAPGSTWRGCKLSCFDSPKNFPGVTIAVHYEIYDGLPLISKWLTVSNQSSRAITLNSVLVEQLAVVEPESIVDGAAANFRGTYRDLEAFSDYSFGVT